MATKATKRKSAARRSLRLGMRGADVKALQKGLERKRFNPGAIDGIFGNGTQAALLAFQRSAGLLADGVAGPRTQAALSGGKPAPLPDATAALDAVAVSRMFPFTPLGNIKRNLPFVLDALKRAGLHDRLMVLMALATIRAETESFEPVAEGMSRFNTSPSGHPFDLYDNRADLGNRGEPDGERYRGRGYIQLTGRHNYGVYGDKIGLGDKLLEDPELACKSDVASDLLAAFLGQHERAIKEALLDQDFALVPVTVRQPDGSEPRVGSGQPGVSDAYSVLGQFSFDASQSARPGEAGLGKFFATGEAATRLSQGFAIRLCDESVAAKAGN